MGEEAAAAAGGSGFWDFFGGLFNTAVNVQQNKEQREWSSEEAQHNRDFQVQMYERQHDDSIAWRTHQEQYNSPEAQMQRYRDAGINPMYVVSGGQGASNTIATPMTASGSGYGSATPSPNQHRLSFSEAFRMRNEAKITAANVKLLESEAREHNANAQNIENNLPKSGFYRKVWDIYANMALPDGDDGSWSTPEMEAGFMFQAKKYELALQLDGFEDARQQFIHSHEVREFEKSLNEHKRKMFIHELSQAKSAAEVFSVSAKWAVANQWINAGSKVIGAASGLLGALKGMSFNPFTSQSIW